MNWYLKSFQELTNYELYALLKQRVDVFVVEQACAYPELDNYDHEALHYFVKEADELVASVRILPRGTVYSEPSIGRVVTSPEYRGRGYGRIIMQKAMDYITNQWHETAIKIGAQTRLAHFYGNLGFRQITDAYLEDGIPHADMIWEQK